MSMSRFILTCEHAKPWAPHYLKIPQRVLNSHQGYDAGALELCEAMKPLLQAKLFKSVVSRLVVDCNRNIKSPDLFSEYTKHLSSAEKHEFIKKYYEPYRHSVIQDVKRIPPTIAISVHSFTPLWKGVTRPTDIGILYRPSKKKERNLALSLQKELKTNCGLKIHMNRPYSGITDCFLNDVLDHYNREPQFNGLFLELNQRLLKKSNIQKMAHLISISIKKSAQIYMQ